VFSLVGEHDDVDQLDLDDQHDDLDHDPRG